MYFAVTVGGPDFIRILRNALIVKVNDDTTESLAYSHAEIDF